MVAASTRIKNQKDEQGNLTHVSIDVRKHEEVIGTLKDIGLLQEDEEEHTVETFYNAMVAEINKHYGTNH